MRMVIINECRINQNLSINISDSSYDVFLTLLHIYIKIITAQTVPKYS